MYGRGSRAEAGGGRRPPSVGKKKEKITEGEKGQQNKQIKMPSPLPLAPFVQGLDPLIRHWYEILCKLRVSGRGGGL